MRRGEGRERGRRGEGSEGGNVIGHIFVNHVRLYSSCKYEIRTEARTSAGRQAWVLTYLP